MPLPTGVTQTPGFFNPNLDVQSGIDFISNWYWNTKNYENQKQAYRDYRKDIEYTRWANENAHQIAVEDMKKAGLNPILAAGQPAQAATQPGQGEAPTRGNDTKMLDVIARKEQISMSQAERARIKAQIDNLEEDSRLKESQKNLNDANTGSVEDQSEYFRGVRSFRSEQEERKNRIERMLEKNTISQAEETLNNMRKEGKGQDLRNDLYEQQKELNEVRKKLEDLGLEYAEMERVERVLRERIANFLSMHNDETSQENLAYLTQVVTLNILIAELNERNHNLGISKEAGVRTTEERRGGQEWSGYIGIPGILKFSSSGKSNW